MIKLAGELDEYTVFYNGTPMRRIGLRPHALPSR